MHEEKPKIFLIPRLKPWAMFC